MPTSMERATPLGQQKAPSPARRRDLSPQSPITAYGRHDGIREALLGR